MKTLIGIFLLLQISCISVIAANNDRYLTQHFDSCGPVALSDIIKRIENKEISSTDISKEIQDTSPHTSFRIFLSIIHNKLGQITFPEEMIEYLTERDYHLTKINFSLLQEEDIALVLIRNKIGQGNSEFIAYHWIVYPAKEEIKEYFGKDKTVVLLTYVIRKNT